MYIDDEYVGFISHGGNETIEEKLEKGSHNIKFTNTEDSEVTGEVEIRVEKEETYKMNLSCHSNGISAEVLEGTLVEDEESNVDVPEQEDTKTEDNKAIEENPKEEVKDEIFTPDNCPELKELLTLKDEFDPKISDFASKYAGDKIEFDANIASMSYHANYNTRFDFLILGGDYSETSISGPYFQLRDVNVFDLNLVGDNIPDSLATGMNIHIIAIVDEYDSNSGLFQLVPVETRMR